MVFERRLTFTWRLLIVVFGASMIYTSGSAVVAGMRGLWSAGAVFKCVVGLLGALGGIYVCTLSIASINRDERQQRRDIEKEMGAHDRIRK